ncbi:hypothetical protein AVEN_125874-1 [Araneus ventricosus]|uniref:Uncharacterized protein n=1 Tax=Araneus ventricosus TaxID=182803 RepID=A0A4Y2F5N7_ARAVE|nr:hypothetical protein AVEN_125874-1 [Araneus ventricosus]
MDWLIRYSMVDDGSDPTSSNINFRSRTHNKGEVWNLLKLCGSNDADVYPPWAISSHKHRITRKPGVPVRLPNGFDWISHMILRSEIDVYPLSGHTWGSLDRATASCSLNYSSSCPVCGLGSPPFPRQRSLLTAPSTCD